jgi:formyl-CoA transferase
VAPAAVVNTYQSADGDWVTVTSATRRSVLNVVRLLGLDAEGFATVEDQLARADELDTRLRQWVGERSAQECLAAMAEAEVVASRIFSVADIMADPIYAEREDIVTVDDEELGPVRMQGVVPKLHEHPGAVWRTGPALGEDNELVYRDWLGLSEQEYRGLQDEEVI